MLPYFSFKEMSIGPITIQIWGLMVSAGFLAALFWSLKEAEENKIDKNYIWDSMLIILAGVIIGSKIFYIISNSIELGDFENVFTLTTGGFSLIGGIIFSLIIIYFYAKIKKINVWMLADVLAPGLLLALIFARIGCFLVNEHIGSVTSSPWGIKYIDGSIRHPVSLYLFISDIVIFLIIWYLKKRESRKINVGVISLVLALCFSASRFLLDFTRCNDLDICDARYLSLTYTQWILLTIIPFVIILIRRRQKLINI